MSALLDHGPHTVHVYTEIQAVDSRGNPTRRPADYPVIVSGCLITPVTSRRDRNTGHVTMDYTLMARDAPIGPWSRVEFEGRQFVVVDGPREYNVSPNTKHVAAILREER
jgi:hypothetical protein